MSVFRIRGGNRLEGEVTVSGAKNAALPIIVASILSESSCRIENLPVIEDMRVLESILCNMGATVDFTPDGGMRVDSRRITDASVTFDMVSSLRASYYLLGALLGRYGFAEVALPGGCVIGPRPIDQHIKGFRALGAEVEVKGGIVTAKAEKLRGAEIYLDVVSVGATINIMLAACRAKGMTVIGNAAKEPHVVDVANFLNMMGASVRGAGTDMIRIMGVDRLHGCTYSIIPDQIEAGTYMIAAAATGGDIIIRNVIPTHLEAISAKLMESGVRVDEKDDGSEFYIRVSSAGRARAVAIKTLPYPGFPTDLQQPMLAYLTTAQGTSVITETIFEERFNHVPELARMGGNILLNGRTALVQGVERLYGANVYASDLRAGASLIIAGLMADGLTTVHNVKYVDRGYEHLERKFQSLGADIIRADS